MKKTNLNKLERAAKLYEQIEIVLDKAYDGIARDDIEYVTFGSSLNTRKESTLHLVSDMLTEAKENRRWIQNRMRDINEQLMKDL